MTDTFKNGGELVDLGTWYAGRDKIQHAIAGFMLAVACRRAGFTRLQMLTLVLLAAIGWEMVEQVRYWRWREAVRRWLTRRSPAAMAYVLDYEAVAVAEVGPPQPLFCDEFSWRDIVATLAGALVALP